MLVSNEKNEKLRDSLEKTPGQILERLAHTYQLSLLQTIQHLPESMWKMAPGEAAFEILKEIAKWGELTTIVHTKDVIMEFVGTFPDGSKGGGFYNLESEDKGSKLAGHLTIDNCTDIVFLKRPFMRVETASIIFFNKEGESMFKVFVGRDEARNLKPDQLAAYNALSEKLTK